METLENAAGLVHDVSLKMQLFIHLCDSHIGFLNNEIWDSSGNDNELRRLMIRQTEEAKNRWTSCKQFWDSDWEKLNKDRPSALMDIEKLKHDLNSLGANPRFPHMPDPLSVLAENFHAPRISDYVA